MKHKRLLLFVMLIFLILSCSRKEEWGNLKNLGPNINSSARDERPTFTGDGKVMYFSSDREGVYNIYMSRFENGEWQPAEKLPSPINTSGHDYDAFITRNGKTLYFVSNREGGEKYWDCAIFVSHLENGKWSKPVKLDKELDVPGLPDWGPSLTEDESLLFFSSGRKPAKKEQVQIWMVKKQNGKWGNPEFLPEPVNSGGWEAEPMITPDGKTIYFNSDRGDSTVNIWSVDFVNGKWMNPKMLPGPFYSTAHDYSPSPHPDGKHFYFASNRPGGFGSTDLYVVEKIK